MAPLVVLRVGPLESTRSNSGIVRSKIDVKTWRERLPTCSEVRPACCTRCSAASRPAGRNLVVHGNGLVARQVRGPPVLGAEAIIVVIKVRTFECQACGAVMTVVPREVLPGFWYAAPAIALALMLYSVEQRSAREVRERVCAWPTSGATGWPTLRRWCTRAPELWRCVRRSPPHWSTRQRAERAAMAIAAHHSNGDLPERVFVGAVRAR